MIYIQLKIKYKIILLKTLEKGLNKSYFNDLSGIFKIYVYMSLDYNFYHILKK